MSAISEASVFGRGETAGATAVTDMVELEGYEKWFPDLDYSQRGVKPRRTNRMVLCRIVRNNSGIALLPKRLGRIEATAGQGRCRVDGYATTTAARGYPIDEFLPATGVADKDLFWIVLKGPAIVKTGLTTLGATIAVGDMVVAQTAATSQATTAGRADARTFTSTAATGVGLQAMLENAIGYCLSAVTSDNTDSNLLVDVNLLN